MPDEVPGAAPGEVSGVWLRISVVRCSSRPLRRLGEFRITASSAWSSGSSRRQGVGPRAVQPGRASHNGILAGARSWRRAERLVLRSTLTAMPISHGPGLSPSSRSFPRSRHASRHVSDTTSSAALRSPVARTACRKTKDCPAIPGDAHHSRPARAVAANPRRAHSQHNQHRGGTESTQSDRRGGTLARSTNPRSGAHSARRHCRRRPCLHDVFTKEPRASWYRRGIDRRSGRQGPALTTAAAGDFPPISGLYEIDHFRGP